MIVHITTFLFFFLLIFVHIPIVFAESLPDIAVTAKEEKDAPDPWCYDVLSKHPNSRNVNCLFEYSCGKKDYWTNYWENIPHKRIILDNDYITQQFLHKNPDISLDDAMTIRIDNRFTPLSWDISGDLIKKITIRS